MRIPRCCADHHDWTTLAEHLLKDFRDVPASAIISELSRARRAGELFHLGLPDALDCAELIVRQRVIIATDRTPFSTADTGSAATFVQVA